MTNTQSHIGGADMSYNEGLNTITGQLAKKPLDALRKDQKERLMAFHLCTFLSDHGMEINLCDNRKNHGTVWIGWARPEIDRDEFWHKGDYDGTLEQAIITAAKEAINKLIRSERGLAGKPEVQS